MRLAARAPNHLGDGIMALPALHALARLGRLVVYAPVRYHALYAGFDLRAPGRIAADRAVLFAPSLRAAWEARRVREVIGTPTDGRRRLLTTTVEERPSRAGTYRALAEAAGARVEGAPRYTRRGHPWPVPGGHVALVPVAGSRNRRWDGFRVLADRLDGPVVFYGGPGEDATVGAIAGPHRRCVGASLPDLAATLQRARVVVSNDTGLAHFARAVGRPTVVIHTSTTAARTGPAGAIAVDGPPLPCRPCVRNRCGRGLGCLAVSVETVLRALEPWR